MNSLKTLSKIDWILAFCLTAFWVVLDPVSLKYTVCHPDGAAPDLFGFPAIAQTSIPWVNSGSQSMYISGLLVNSCFWGSIFLVVFYFLSKLSIKTSFIKRFVQRLKILAILFMLGFLVLSTSVIEISWEWSHPFNIVDCPVELHFFD